MRNYELIQSKECMKKGGSVPKTSHTFKKGGSVPLSPHPRHLCLSGSSDAVFQIYHYQTFLQRLQTLTIHAVVYGIQLHFQNFKRAKNDWTAGHVWPTGSSLDTTGLESVSSNAKCISNNRFERKINHM